MKPLTAVVPSVITQPVSRLELVAKRCKINGTSGSEIDSTAIRSVWRNFYPLSIAQSKWINDTISGSLVLCLVQITCKTWERFSISQMSFKLLYQVVAESFRD